MALVNNIQSELKSYLETLLKNEDISDVNCHILGNTEKGDNYMGDVFFLTVSGKSKNGSVKNYDLVLKCSKSSQALREKSPVKPAFLNEIYCYDVVFPSFKQFQEVRKIPAPFEKVPKCYGTLSTGSTEIIALENLKCKGYALWDRKIPLTRKHINMVVEEYGKLHATSLAMQHQQPEEFKKLVSGLDNILTRFVETTEVIESLEGTVQLTLDLLADDLDKNTLDKWSRLKSQVRVVFKALSKPVGEVNVIIHGDCWNNNFIFHHTDNEPTNVAVLDWQLATFSSPIIDLSYFLFTCLSEEDMNDLDNILTHYHTNLANHLRKFGDGLEKLYSLNQFQHDWTKYCNFGIIMSTSILKFSLCENDEVPDMAQAAENGEDVAKVFSRPVKDSTLYKKRMQYIVKYVTENQLV